MLHISTGAMWDHLTQDDSIIGYSRTEKMCVACQIIIPDENSKIVQHITSYGHKQKKNLKLENTKQVLSAPGCELCGVNYGGCAKEEYLHLVGKKHNSNLSKKLKSQPKDTTYKTKDTPSSAGIQDTPNKTAQNLDNSTDNAERANKSIDYGVSGLYGLVSDGVITSVDSDAKLSNVLDYGVCDENAVKKADKNEDKTADKKADKKKVHCDDTSINNAQSDALESLDKIGLKEKLRSVQMDLKSLRQKEGKENDVKVCFCLLYLSP